jgi:tetrahydromethanopterin S-methyltransferase subunit H
MFRFETQQKISQIGKIKVGGQPGELPTVLIGSIFYSGQKIVKDPKTGVFDKMSAETLVKRQEELSDISGNPCMLDVVLESENAIHKILSFIADTSDLPILFDAWPQNVRIKGLKVIEELGIAKRCVYNSLSIFNTKNELNALRESKIDAALILTFNPSNHLADGAMSILKGTHNQKGVLDTANEIGIEKLIVDTSVTSFMPSIGIAARAAFLIKQELGLPCGLGPANATTSYRRSNKIWKDEALRACEVAAQTFALSLCSNFLLYGPIEDQEWIFPACGTVDAIVKTAVIESQESRKIDEAHPIFRMYPEFVKKFQKLFDPVD